MEAGLLVIADTGAQIGKAIRVVENIRKELPDKRFGVIVDESDAMYRTKDGRQVMEQNFTALMEMKPSFRLEISATPFSSLQALEEQGKDIDMMEIMTTDDYSGINEMKHFQRDGKDIFIKVKQDEITYGTGVSWHSSGEFLTPLSKTTEVLFEDDCQTNKKCTACMTLKGCENHSDIASKRWGVDDRAYIPYTCDSMMALFEDALNASKQGTLILCATNSRVYADDNVVEQAARIQNHFRGEGKDMAVLVATGRGMELRLPGFKKGRFIRRNLKTISEIIEEVDKVVGLDTPIAVFGYSRMCRCVSFRSNARVPTHLILTRGPGYSLEDYIQALGRATFNGLSVLKQNGHDGVTVLTDDNDFLAAKKYYVFVQEIVALLQKNPGMNVVAAYRGAVAKFPDEANFFRHTNRKIGRRKDFADKGPGNEAFEDPEDFDDARNKKERYKEDQVVHRVVKTFLRMAEDDSAFKCDTDTLTEYYNNFYPSAEMMNGTMQKQMAALEKDVLFVKIAGTNGSRSCEYQAKSLDVLQYIVEESDFSSEDEDDDVAL